MRFKDIRQETKEGSWECNYSLCSLVEFITDLENGVDTQSPLQMNPDFQRSHVWTEEQQEKYIEALLRNGAKNARTIYLNCPSWNNVNDFSDKYNDFVCVDGLQRYTAIKKFVNNELRVFETLFSEFEDYKVFSRKHIIKVNINDLKTKKEVLKWYLEMNDNGTPHTKKEINKVKNMLKKEEFMKKVNDPLENTDFKRIEKVNSTMTAKDKDKFIKILETSFDEYFKD